MSTDTQFRTDTAVTENKVDVYVDVKKQDYTNHFKVCYNGIKLVDFTNSSEEFKISEDKVLVKYRNEKDKEIIRCDLHDKKNKTIIRGPVIDVSKLSYGIVTLECFSFNDNVYFYRTDRFQHEKIMHITLFVLFPKYTIITSIEADSPLSGGRFKPKIYPVLNKLIIEYDKSFTPYVRIYDTDHAFVCQLEDYQVTCVCDKETITLQQTGKSKRYFYDLVNCRFFDPKSNKSYKRNHQKNVPTPEVIPCSENACFICDEDINEKRAMIWNHKKMHKHCYESLRDRSIEVVELSYKNKASEE